MLPVLWRHIILQFLKIFTLSVLSFIAILLTSRLEEIAHFASFGASLELIGVFTLLQIPYILPIAIPVGCLIAGIFVMQKMSEGHEISALRSSGYSLSRIIAPLLILSAALSLFNGYVVSELSTLSHMKTNLLKNEL